MVHHGSDGLVQRWWRQRLVARLLHSLPLQRLRGGRRRVLAPARRRERHVHRRGGLCLGIFGNHIQGVHRDGRRGCGFAAALATAAVAVTAAALAAAALALPTTSLTLATAALTLPTTSLALSAASLTTSAPSHFSAVGIVAVAATLACTVAPTTFTTFTGAPTAAALATGTICALAAATARVAAASVVSRVG